MVSTILRASHPGFADWSRRKDAPLTRCRRVPSLIEIDSIDQVQATTIGIAHEDRLPSEESTLRETRP